MAASYASFELSLEPFSSSVLAALLSLTLLSVPSADMIFKFPFFATIGASLEYEILKLLNVKFTSPSASTIICPSSKVPVKL